MHHSRRLSVLVGPALAQDVAGPECSSFALIGGTGAFECVRGRIVIEAGDPPTYVFDLVCA